MKSLLAALVLALAACAALGADLSLLPNGCYLYASMWTIKHGGQIVVVRHPNGDKHALAVKAQADGVIVHDELLGNFAVASVSPADVQAGLADRYEVMRKLKRLAEPRAIPARDAIGEAVSLLSEAGIPAYVAHGRIYWRNTETQWCTYAPREGSYLVGAPAGAIVEDVAAQINGRLVAAK